MTQNVIKGIFDTGIEIKPVTSLRGLKDFIFLPWRIYKNSPQWTPTLISKEFRRLSRRINPFFKHSSACFFVAYQNGKPVGRIAAISNSRHQKYYRDQNGFFGFFECVENYYVAKRLLQEAENWCLAHGKSGIYGPVNLSIHEEYGLLIDGFGASPPIFMPYNPPYYADFLERHGFRKRKDLLSYRVGVADFIAQTAAFKDQRSRLYTCAPIRFRPLNWESMGREITHILSTIFNSEWQQEYGYVPLTKDEIKFRFREYAKWAYPDLVLVGEVGKDIVGFMINIPNFNEVIHRFNGPLSFLNHLLLSYHKHRIRGARTVLMTIKKYYRHRGFHIHFIHETLKRLNSRNFTHLEIGWIAEDHIAARHFMEDFNLHPDKRYRLYFKEIAYEHYRKISKHSPLSNHSGG